MKCPYTINIQQVSQDIYQHDENGSTTFHENKLLELREYIECLQEDCAAWRDGGCRYKQD